MTDAQNHFDVIIIGAGLSGIDAAYHLQTKCPSRRYAILEGRARMGGTWDLFRYPGVRSDSDMYTLGYPFRPWKTSKALADGPSILQYIQDTASAYGIDRHIRYGVRVERARWSSADKRWTLEARDAETGEALTFTASFVFACVGYYDYEAGYTPEFAGRERFRGRIVHPQHWPDDLDYDGKRVIVIGSGATAVTLVPEMAKRAAHVTMLQRSPTYVFSLPDAGPITNWMHATLPEAATHDIQRWRHIAMGAAFYTFCRRQPERAKRWLVGEARKQLGGDTALTAHFTPTYKPWDQRVCFAPEGDMFKVIREGKASVVTDHIDTFTETGIRTRSGLELEADVIVTATGLKLKFLGGIAVEVDGAVIEPAKQMTYKGLMCSDVPNFALAVGYTNASWTLKCDLTSEFVCRVLNHMDRHGYKVCRPHNDDPSVEALPLLDFSSGYVVRDIDKFPKQGSRAPWRLYQNYLLDRAALRHGAIDDGALRFE